MRRRAQTIFTQPFEIKGNRNVRITASAPGISNSWAELDADLVNEQNNEVESVPINIEYYQGSDSDGAWTEGEKDEDATLSSLPAGNYTLARRGKLGQLAAAAAASRQSRAKCHARRKFLLCVCWCWRSFPLLALFRKFTFESKRWSESMFTEVTA